VSDEPQGVEASALVGDIPLVMAVARRDSGAMAQIYERYRRSVFGLAKRVLRDQGLAEEVTQEVFLRLWNEPQRFDPGRGLLRTLLLTWTHGRSVDVLRGEVARRRREEVHAVKSSEPPPASLDETVIELSSAQRMRDAVSKLRAEEREAISLAYFGGHSYREVASLLGEPEGTVKGRIRSAMSKLREEIGSADRGGAE
jgi:RNA polymerase sigma-70 factor (ECF subfamily)